MTPVQAMILGIVQGITEFLPVSSSGHLVLLQRIWHISGDQLWFITFLHLGTLLAVIWAFRDEVGWLIRHPASPEAKRILVALVPTALIGALFEDLFENLFSSGITVGFEFVVTGAILWWMDQVQAGAKTEGSMSYKDALWIGALQGAAILPALSRSGLTIAGGLWRGLSREGAARFSFLLSIPAILGATLVEAEELWEHPALWADFSSHAVWIGMLSALVAGYLAVRGTLWLVRTARMRIFALYTWALAAIVFADQIFWHQWFPPLWG
ncbi:MAG: undecaprenyl-diphosphate phosphatase [Thermoflavifilum sp.]|nr:undecaprenyl-diphosphate phosphatase [Thermoflavifilum sp.]MCL6513942.1 undecaprenyl-diphosphate phosphatase [Alicyclobacillus sp.]